MLRITATAEDRTDVTLRLEGKIASEWVETLRTECQRMLSEHRRVHLDFHAVTSVDRRGAHMLRGLVCERIAIVNCPPLVRDILAACESK
jgi:anti-anti-sigma regulatory factor